MEQHHGLAGAEILCEDINAGSDRLDTACPYHDSLVCTIYLDSSSKLMTGRKDRDASSCAANGPGPMLAISTTMIPPGGPIDSTANVGDDLHL
jgi:hypothetical protein